MKRHFRLPRRASIGAAIAALIGLALVVPTSGTANAATGDFTIRQASSGRCLQPQNGFNTQIVTASCNSSTAQLWAVVTSPTSGMMFVSRVQGGPCLVVHNNLTVVGAPVEAESCSPDPNEFWALVATSAPPNGPFVFQNPASRLCAGLFNTFLGLQNCDLSSTNQRFALVAA
jgi:hypothetical protein